MRESVAQRMMMGRPLESAKFIGFFEVPVEEVFHADGRPAVFYFGARNETIGGLAAPRRDERWAMINQRALAFAGTASWCPGLIE